MPDLLTTWKSRDIEPLHWAFAAHVEEGLALGEKLHPGEMETNGLVQTLHNALEEVRDCAAYLHGAAVMCEGQPLLHERCEKVLQMVANLWIAVADTKRLFDLHNVPKAG